MLKARFRVAFWLVVLGMCFGGVGCELLLGTTSGGSDAGDVGFDDGDGVNIGGGDGGGGDGGGGDGECASPEECTDGDWDIILERALEELEREGYDITAETLNEADTYWAVFDRMYELAGGGTVSKSFEPYRDEIEYCGPGQSEYGGSYSLPYVGPCLNQACHSHDNCYGTMTEGFESICTWSDATAHCDGLFFGAYDACAAAGQCGVRCKLVGALARRQATACTGPVNSGNEAMYCDARRERCSSCTPVSDAEACGWLGVPCGSTINGCGDVIENCGDCPTGETCVRAGRNRCSTGAVGDHCGSTVDCTPGAICWNEVCVQNGELRISLSWWVDSDFDLHVRTPSGAEIYYDNRGADGGALDVDDCVTTCLDPSGTHVENIYFAQDPPAGQYAAWVVNYDGRAGGSYELELSIPGYEPTTTPGSLPATEGAESSVTIFSIAAD